MFMKKKIIAKIYRWILSLLLLGVLLFACLFITMRKIGWGFAPVRPQEPWMTVFIHGSFSSLLGFLNFTDVLHDTISGTKYRNVTKKIRSDPFFYKDQAILQRGLIPIDPTLDIRKASNRKYVIYPLVKAYQKVQEAVSPGKEKNYFYAFGWSGLMSQNSRRFEAIRLYNALSEELEKFKSRGITPKIRLICHSHGGNLSLNLAAINKVLAAQLWNGKKELSQDPDENESLLTMRETLKDVATKEIAKTRVDQKVYDYIPEHGDLIIDELIMFGNPMQPETEGFCFSGTFKKVYSFYSDEDFVQRFDWVSSKKPLSGQRISRLVKSKQEPYVVQARIMVEQPVTDGKIKIKPKNPAQSVALTQPKPPINMQPKEPTIIDELRQGRNIFVRISSDPTHKELWFMTWNEIPGQLLAFLYPFPMMILSPMLIHAIEQTQQINDADITINATSTVVQAFVAQHQDEIIKGSASIPRMLLSNMQQKIKAWKPEKDSYITDFNVIYKYLM